MTIIDVFDAIRDGDFQDFLRHFNGDINQVDEILDINLLCMAATNNKKSDEKIKIIKFLLKEGANVNHVTRKHKKNILHIFYSSVLRPEIAYEVEITRLLIDAGVNLNTQDIYLAIPLNYAISVNKLPTQDNKEMYKLLIRNGSDYNLKDKFGKSCLDYADQFPWRNDFIDIIKECENEQ